MISEALNETKRNFLEGRKVGDAFEIMGFELPGGFNGERRG